MKYYSETKQALDQEILREVEALCTQDEPPACTAACPVRLDARAVIGHIKNGEWKKAWALYTKTIPFPRIISSLCDAPCEGVCRRAVLGGAIRLQGLEKYLCSRMAEDAKAPLLLPKKDKKIAVIGGSLAGCAAAHDLARKGYKVTLFEKTEKLGGALRGRFDSNFSEAGLDADFGILFKLPVAFRFGESVSCGTVAELEGFIRGEGFDAAYIACETGLAFDPETLETAAANVAAGRRGGRPRHDGGVIYELFDGKSAATTLDRLLQGVSVTAGREGEGPCETSLYTNLDGVESVSPGAIDTESGESAAVAEAARCLNCQCLECVKKCSFLRSYKSYPGRYVREVYNNLSIPLGTHHANGMINACAMCSRCEAVCPNGLDMKSVFLAARRLMVETEKMPPSAHEFALLDMDFSMSESFFLARGGEKCEYLFFPGCQLPASEPELARRAFDDLRVRLGDVSIMLSCCGIMAHWAGDGKRFEAAVSKIRAEWELLGRPALIAACPTCMTTLRDLAGLPVVGIWDIFNEKGLPGREGRAENKRLSLHHACGARYDKNTRDAVRAIVSELGYEIDEPAGSQTDSPCCGYGGLMPFADGEAADRMSESAIFEFPEKGTILTYCVNCRDRYLAKGAGSVHLLELIYGGDLNRRAPKWSERQENRARLRRELLRDIWNEETAEMSEITLELAPGLLDKMEKLKILRSDLARAIENAEAGGARLIKRDGRILTGHRPGNVTLWVEYEKRGEGFYVFNAYMHRMLAQAAGVRQGGEDE